ncbi:hypothetical protein, partial [Paraburkholderia sp. J67]|uniref:hypothetical protein n=1 Tax=Paraburkholderia sp. J67 TaxID=2805435 RepID=UPI002ABD1604
ILPYANQQEIPDLRFLATWNFWFSRFRPELDPLTDAMPRRAVFSNLASRLEAGHHFSLDVMCRILANPSYRNRAQAVPEMVDANLHLLAPVESVVDLPGAPAVRGVRLSDHGRALLKEMLVDPSLEAFADGLEEGDPVE